MEAGWQAPRKSARRRPPPPPSAGVVVVGSESAPSVSGGDDVPGLQGASVQPGVDSSSVKVDSTATVVDEARGCRGKTDTQSVSTVPGRAEGRLRAQLSVEDAGMVSVVGAPRVCRGKAGTQAGSTGLGEALFHSEMKNSEDGKGKEDLRLGLSDVQGVFKGDGKGGCQSEFKHSEGGIF